MKSLLSFHLLSKKVIDKVITLLAGLLSGNGNYAPSFNNRGINTNWWSSSAASATTAYNRELNSSNTGVNRNNNNKAYSFSVRCLKD